MLCTRALRVSPALKSFQARRVTHQVNSSEAYLNLTAEYKKSQKQKHLLIQYTAAWCGPCRAIKPKVEQLEQKKELDVAFVDVDDCPDVAEDQDVTSVPTFVLCKGMVKIGRVLGADAARLSELVAEVPDSPPCGSN